MEGMGGVEPVSVLGPVVVAFEHWVGLPAFAVEVGMVGREAAGLRVQLLRLQPFLGGTEGGVGLAVGSLEELMRRGLPIACLR